MKEMDRFFFAFLASLAAGVTSIWAVYILQTLIQHRELTGYLICPFAFLVYITFLLFFLAFVKEER